MSTPIYVNTEVVRLVRETDEETQTADGLEALRLVLEKFGGKPGLITNPDGLTAAYRYVVQKLAALRPTDQATPPAEEK